MNTTYIGKGSRSAFYKVTQRKGLKTFYSKKSATYAHTAQYTLSEYNLAPKIYGGIKKLRAKNSGNIRWGYYTELAKTIACNLNECTCGKCEDVENAMIDEITDLVNEIEECGYYFSDSHIGNIGYVRREGKSVLVCIDTGEESLEVT